jgi:hypothetical protein
MTPTPSQLSARHAVAPFAVPCLGRGIYAIATSALPAGRLNRPGLSGDSWLWKPGGVHAEGAHSWEADDAAVFA